MSRFEEILSAFYKFSYTRGINFWTLVKFASLASLSLLAFYKLLKLFSRSKPKKTLNQPGNHLLIIILIIIQ